MNPSATPENYTTLTDVTHRPAGASWASGIGATTCALTLGDPSRAFACIASTQDGAMTHTRAALHQNDVTFHLPRSEPQARLPAVALPQC
jgi:hypothetical protein